MLPIESQPEDRPRSTAELAALHNLLGRIVNGPVLLPITPDQQEVLEIMLGTLCWVLQHPAGEMTEFLIADIKRLMESAGYGDGKRPPDPGLANWPLN